MSAPKWLQLIVAGFLVGLLFSTNAMVMSTSSDIKRLEREVANLKRLP